MSNEALKKARELLFAAATKPTTQSKTPVEVFIGKIDAQLALLEEAKAGTPVSARKSWWRKDPTGYVVKIGRDPLDMGQGNRLFAAKDLEAVGVILNTARELVQQDDAIGKQIEANAKARRDRLRKAK